MSESKPHQLPPGFQIGICLLLIVVLRLYYAWIESQTHWLYPRFADSLPLLFAIYLGLVPSVSLVAAIAAYRYFSPAMTIPFAAVGGGAAGLIVNSIPAALIGSCIGLLVYSSSLRHWLASAGRIVLRFDLPALLWGAWLGSIATCLFVQNSSQVTSIRVGLSIAWVIGVAALLYFAYRAYRTTRGKLFQAIVGCVIASALGLVIGPMANSLYRIYSLQRVGYVTWDPTPRFNGLGGGFWEIYGVVLESDATDQHLNLVQGMPTITSLSIEGADLSDEALAAVLRKLPNLHLFEITDVAIGDEGLEPLATAGSLLHAQLTGTSISDATLANLANVPTLQILAVDGATRQGRGLRDLARAGRIRYLTIHNMPLVDEDLADLNGLQGLNSLDLGGTKITGSGLKSLSQHPRLMSLRLAESPLQDHYLADLDPTALNWLKLEGIPLSDAGATAIGSMTNLLGLSLRRTNLTDSHLQQMGNLPSTHLALDGKNLSSTAGDYLVAEDVEIHVDDEELTVDDIERLMAIGYDVQLTNCQLDGASIERLSGHASEPRFLIRLREFDEQMAKQLSGASVRVTRYWPD